MKSASNDWEADPLNATDEVADAQLAGFRLRAAKPINWFPIQASRASVSGIDTEKLRSADVEFYAECDGEEMLLMQLIWHGFPDPPECD